MTYATDRLMKNARTSLPGSLDEVIRLEFFNVLDDFFKNTRAWTEETDFTVAANDPVGTIYYIEPEAVANIVSLMSACNSNGTPVKAVMDLPGEVTLLTPPGQNETYTATISLTITDPTQSDGFPDFPAWVLEKYNVGLLDGVLGRMMAQPAKPYTNAALAGAHLKLFRQAMSIAATEALHRNVHGGQAWMFPQTFATRGQRR